jgi:hypothetical protein
VVTPYYGHIGDLRYLYMRWLGQSFRFLFIYVLAQEYIQLQLYKSEKTRISQSLSRHCNWRVGPWISVGQMLHVHAYDRTAWKPHICFRCLVKKKRMRQRRIQIFPKRGPGMEFEKHFVFQFCVRKSGGGGVSPCTPLNSPPLWNNY